LKSKRVKIERVPQGLLITDLDDVADRAAVFDSLEGSCPGFPEIEVNSTPNIARDFE